MEKDKVTIAVVGTGEPNRSVESCLAAKDYRLLSFPSETAAMSALSASTPLDLVIYDSGRSLCTSEGERLLNAVKGHFPEVPILVRSEVLSDVLAIFRDYPSLEELEKRYMKLVLEKTNGRKEKAARILGINRRTLYRKEREYGWVTGDDEGFEV